MSNIFADLLTNNLSRLSIDNDSDDENDLSTLPFPQPLSRVIFSSPSFDTESFLLSHSQFRTLDDLRSELRQWVDRLDNEMEKLIEEDWQGYLSLGRGLTGGEVVLKDMERRIKQAEREILTVKRRIEERIRDVDIVLKEKKQVREKADFTKQLLAIHSSLLTLEMGLLLRPDDSIMMDNTMSLYSLDRLQRLVSQYKELTYFIDRIPQQHPFLQMQQPRIQKIKQTLNKDLRDALSTKKKEDNALEAFQILRICSTTNLNLLTP